MPESELLKMRHTVLQLSVLLLVLLASEAFSQRAQQPLWTLRVFGMTESVRTERLGERAYSGCPGPPLTSPGGAFYLDGLYEVNSEQLFSELGVHPEVELLRTVFARGYETAIDARWEHQGSRVGPTLLAAVELKPDGHIITDWQITIHGHRIDPELGYTGRGGTSIRTWPSEPILLEVSEREIPRFQNLTTDGHEMVVVLLNVALP